MQPILYSSMVYRLKKDPQQIQEELHSRDCDMLHMLLGLMGEVGELADAIKRPTMYRKPIDMVNVVEELGDIEFYLEGLRQTLGVTREKCLGDNMRKLETRYSSGRFTKEDAVNRKDKTENEAK